MTPFNKITFYWLRNNSVDADNINTIQFSLFCFKLLDNDPDVPNKQVTDYKQLGVSV
jgi:hypothetical protein